MTYDKNSFLAGIAVGRQLKGWNLYPQEASMVGWTANPGWVWRQPGLIGHINPGTVTTFQDLGVGSPADMIDGNMLTDPGRGYYDDGVKLLGDRFPFGSRVMLDLTILEVSQYPLRVSGANANAEYPIIGTGVFYTTADGWADAYTLGRGTATWVNWRGQINSNGLIRAYGLWNETFKVYVNGVYLNEHCLAPGGDYAWKKKAGPAIVCIARYINADGYQITTPVLISDRQTAVEWSFFQDGITQESYATQQEYHGNLYYMGTSGDLLTGSASSSTGAQILDLTAGSRISTSTELFLAVAAASGLSTL